MNEDCKHIISDHWIMDPGTGERRVVKVCRRCGRTFEAPPGSNPKINTIMFQIATAVAYRLAETGRKIAARRGP